MTLTETLLALYENERFPAEDFTLFANRIGTKRLKEVLDPLRHVPSFDTDPSFYEDYGHEHERFAVRHGIKGECAGSTVAATVPTIEVAREWLAQAEALVYHKEYQQAVMAAYESAAAGARVLLYRHLVDPFTSDEALWEFENLFVLSGQMNGEWEGLSTRFEELKFASLQSVRQSSVDREITPGDSDGEKRQTEVYRTSEALTRELLVEARNFVSYCALLEKRETKKTGVAA